MKYKLFPLILLVLLASCTITKRRYSSGYSISWKHRAPKITSRSGTGFSSISKPQGHLPTLTPVQHNSLLLPPSGFKPPAKTGLILQHSTATATPINITGVKKYTAISSGAGIPEHPGGQKKFVAKPMYL